MKKLNIFYIFWLFLFVLACFLVGSFVKTSQTTVFGTADTEGQVLNFEYPVFVHKVWVQTGSRIKKGDTLMTLQRSDLERSEALKNTEINVNFAEKQARISEIDKEKERLRADFTAKTNDMRTQIQLLEAEEKMQSALRKVVDNSSKSDNNKSLLVEKINTLKKAISIEEQSFSTQSKRLDQAKNAESSVFESRKQSTRQELGFLQKERNQLILMSPIDGFVENIYAFENQITPQYSQLIKVNPQKPNKIKGFLPESVDLAYRLGDTVEVYAARRPTVKSKAVLIGSNPQLVELPLRLRKYQTASSWGRELYINLPIENDFYIGEKIIIKINGY